MFATTFDKLSLNIPEFKDGVSKILQNEDKVVIKLYDPFIFESFRRTNENMNSYNNSWVANWRQPGLHDNEVEFIELIENHKKINDKITINIPEVYLSEGTCIGRIFHINDIY